MERKISDSFIITEEEIVTDRIYEMISKVPDMEKVAEYIEKGKYTKYFFDQNLNMKSENDRKVYMVWLDSGLKTGADEPIMISLLRRDEDFEGYFVGTPHYLVSGMCNRDPYNARILRNNQLKFAQKYKKQHARKQEDLLEKEVPHMAGVNTVLNREEKVSVVAEEIYNNLLFPHWNSIKGLDRYIKITGKRVKQLMEQGKGQYYIKNRLQSVIVNTGMMNLFGEDYLVLYKYFVKYDCYIADSVIQGKEDYLRHDFTKEQASVQIEPINFFNEDDEVFFPDIDEFDINQKCLIHIIRERKDRFPESIKEQSDSRIAELLINALKRGLKMQKRDRSFARAIYSGTTGIITWLLPLHIEAAISEKPELVMAVRKKDDFYEVKTVLPYNDEIRNKITALSLYKNIW